MHSYYQQAHPFSSNITEVITPTIINPIGYDGRFNPSNEWTTPGLYTVSALNPNEERIYPPAGDITYRDNATPQGQRALFHNITKGFLVQDNVLKARHEGSSSFIAIGRTFRVSASDSDQGSYQRYYNQIYDDDAIAYISAVEAADGQALEYNVKSAIHDFIVGCKSDPSPVSGVSNWDAIKSACFLAGPRTLSGIFTPLKGTAPTNVNFVSGDYNRITGLKGNGINKRINSQRANNDDPQNNRGFYVYVTEASTASSEYNVYIGTGIDSNMSAIYRTSAGGPAFVYFRPSATATLIRVSWNGGVGGLGFSRYSSTHVDILTFDVFEGNVANTSGPQNSSNIGVFAGTSDRYDNPRMAIYCIGEAFDQKLLNARVKLYLKQVEMALSSSSPSPSGVFISEETGAKWVVTGSIV